MRTARAFTLFEMIIAIAIAMLMMLIAVPSYNGVMADRRLRRSLNDFNSLVHQAQERSLTEHRAYLIVLGKSSVFLRPEALREDDSPEPVAEVPIAKNETVKLLLPAALTKNPPSEWIFWATGTCEPAVVEYVGRNGTWTANYSSLTAHGELTKYAAR